MVKKNKTIIKSILPIILASKSISRRSLLRETGLKFKQLIPNVNEDSIKKKYSKKSFNYLAKKLALEKALSISCKNKKAFVIGADQLCVSQNKVYSKPKFKKKAVDQLIEINGRIHQQISAVSICYNNIEIWSYTEIARMTMRKLPIKVIKKYVDTDLPLYSCGSYKFESNGKYLFSKIEGNYSTILGLPMFPLLDFLYKKNVIEYV